MTRSVAVRLFAIFGLVSLVYAPTLVAPFCSFDDILEVDRAAFTDAPNPSLVFMTPHFNTAHYRPLNRLLNLVTFRVGNGRATPFRVRNLLSHLACVALAFALSLALFQSPGAALWGALLFGLHPLANMSVVGAVVTNTVGHGLLLGALLVFLWSLRATSSGPALAGVSLVMATLAILTYESEIAYFPLAALLLVVEIRFYGRRPGAGLLAAWLGGGAALVGGCVALHTLVVPLRRVTDTVPSLATFAKGLTIYGGALLLPLDSVLLHHVLGTPYPSELASPGAAGRGLALVLLGCSAAAALILAVRAGRRVTPEVRAAAAPGAVFAACSVPLLLSPFLLFTKHASETYMYLPAAFVALLAGVLLNAASRTTPRAAVTAGALLAVLAGAATWSRNLAVLRCGQSAERLIAGIQAGAAGKPSLLVANAPGEERTRWYGFYGFRGTDTIGRGWLADWALTSALELERGGRGATVKLLEPDELRREACAPLETRKPAFWVRADGSVSECACDATKETR